jgi:hypothetical protein
VGIEIFEKVCAAATPEEINNPEVYVVFGIVFQVPEVPTRYCKIIEFCLSPLGGVPVKDGFPISAAVQDALMLPLFVVFIAIQIAPILLEPEFNKLIPEPTSFRILPVENVPVDTAITLSAEASVVIAEDGSPENDQPCIDAGYVVVVPAANPVNVKLLDDKLCAVGFVCPHTIFGPNKSRNKKTAFKKLNFLSKQLIDRIIQISFNGSIDLHHCDENQQ